MKPFSSIDMIDHALVGRMFLHPVDRPLSGYLAGRERGGYYVRALEDAWSATFGVKHAIAVNSATSGLLAAAFAVGLKSGDKFICSPMTMSATAAAPMFTGATPIFRDVEDETFGISPAPIGGDIRAIFSTNLFGHAADPQSALMQHTTAPLYHIEDNAQSPFAMAHGCYAGTFGHIGVWSLNIHKPIQCGEGGVVTTDDDELARKLRNFINHGENVGDPIGLNLRMPELCAAVAIEQLRRGPEIINGRIDQAEAILAAIGDIPGLRKPVTRKGCNHVYYTIPFLLTPKPQRAWDESVSQTRDDFCAALRDDGIPIEAGYIDPLYRMPAFRPFFTRCPVAEDLQDRRLFYFENCAWDCSPSDVVKIGDAFKRAAEKWL